MTQQERNEVGIVIALTAQYYGRELKKEVVAMMVSDLEDLSMVDVLRAYNSYRKDGRNRNFPLPAQIREIIEPEINPETASREISSRIMEAVHKFGYARGEDAKEFIGRIGWTVVESFGGWDYICKNLGLDLSMQTFNAQCRDLIKGRFIHGDSLGEQARKLQNYRDNSLLQNNKEQLNKINLTIKTIGE